MTKKQCCANAQWACTETIEIVGIPKPVLQNQLEDTVCNILYKLNC